ncbi:MAG: DegT/DnrJ/EryC1/StrS family aminotransferase [Candidatus Omnitrophica bacterium]|nr:DegT/DnrJ/EryC1/StrS family aminotransferase [Candidatus Omnitrophota bacterium]
MSPKPLSGAPASTGVPASLTTFWDAAPAVKVPYTALGQQAAALKQDLLAACQSILESGQYVMGPELAAFEREFAEYCGTRFAVGVANGTDALILVLRRLALQAGDEVITAPNSFIASASSIALAGGRPVFADIGVDLNLDPAQVEAAITPRTKAIVPVHLTGRPARMDEILAIAKRYRLYVLEDAAQAVGAKLHDRRAGSWGDAACFSLHPLKNLHAFGDGGVVTTNDEPLYRWLLQARNHGLKNRDECAFWSVNSRLDEIQAAMLRVQLRHLDQWTAERRRLAARYAVLLKPHVEVPEERPGEHHVFQTYMIQADRRDALLRHLNDHDIEARVHYPVPLHRQPVTRDLGYGTDALPIATRAAGRILSLPLYPGLTEAQQQRVAQLIAEFYRR